MHITAALSFTHSSIQAHIHTPIGAAAMQGATHPTAARKKKTNSQKLLNKYYYLFKFSRITNYIVLCPHQVWKILCDWQLLLVKLHVV